MHRRFIFTERFTLGRIVITPQAREAASLARLMDCLQRHARCDWGNIDAQDAADNDRAIVEGRWLLSVYPIDPAQPPEGNNALLIATEADRSVTCLLIA